MTSSAQKGSYYKSRTRVWLKAHGYDVAEFEVVRTLVTPKGRIGVKRDQWGADLLAKNADRLVLVQVKGGAGARTGYFPEAQRAFAAWAPFPPGVECWIVAWPERAHEPRVIGVHALSVPEPAGC